MTESNTIEQARQLYIDGDYLNLLSCVTSILNVDNQNAEAWAYAGLCALFITGISETNDAFTRASGHWEAAMKCTQSPEELAAVIGIINEGEKRFFAEATGNLLEAICKEPASSKIYQEAYADIVNTRLTTSRKLILLSAFSFTRFPEEERKPYLTTIRLNSSVPYDIWNSKVSVFIRDFNSLVGRAVGNPNSMSVYRNYCDAACHIIFITRMALSEEDQVTALTRLEKVLRKGCNTICMRCGNDFAVYARDMIPTDLCRDSIADARMNLYDKEHEDQSEEEKEAAHERIKEEVKKSYEQISGLENRIQSLNNQIADANAARKNQESLKKLKIGFGGFFTVLGFYTALIGGGLDSSVAILGGVILIIGVILLINGLVKKTNQVDIGALQSEIRETVKRLNQLD